MPLQQDVAHVEVSPAPVIAVYVVYSCNAHEVVEVYFVGGVILVGS